MYYCHCTFYWYSHYFGLYFYYQSEGETEITQEHTDKSLSEEETSKPDQSQGTSLEDTADDIVNEAIDENSERLS